MSITVILGLVKDKAKIKLNEEPRPRRLLAPIKLLSFNVKFEMLISLFVINIQIVNPIAGINALIVAVTIGSISFREKSVIINPIDHNNAAIIGRNIIFLSILG